MRYRYSDAEIKSLLQSMVILADTREQRNEHIIKYLSGKKAECKSQALKTGDYSAMLPKNTELGIVRDLYFTDAVIIERKNSLDELAGNIGKERQRFEAELERSKGKFFLLVEGASWPDLLEGRYNSAYTAKAFAATLQAFIARYGIILTFLPPSRSGEWIHSTLAYHVREYLLNGDLRAG